MNDKNFRILVTGFEPFGGEPVNPSWEAVKLLPDMIGGKAVYKLQVPVIYGDAGKAVIAEAERISADAVLSIGQAGGRAAVTPEMIAINLRYANAADNAGNILTDIPCVDGAPDGYMCTLTARRMSDAVNAAGVKSAVSYSAGTFVCNDLMFSLLHRFTGTSVRCGFIHVPFLPSQAKNGAPSMELEDIAKALEAAIMSI